MAPLFAGLIAGMTRLTQVWLIGQLPLARRELTHQCGRCVGKRCDSFGWPGQHLGLSSTGKPGGNVETPCELPSRTADGPVFCGLASGATRWSALAMYARRESADFSSQSADPVSVTPRPNDKTTMLAASKTSSGALSLWAIYSVMSLWAIPNGKVTVVGLIENHEERS